MSGSLTVHVLDDDQNPVEGEEVFCSFIGSFFGLADTNSREYTDEEGIAEFDDVPVGAVRVYVAGEQVDVEVGEGEHEDITVTI